MHFSSSDNENNQTVYSGCNDLSKYIFGLDFVLIINPISVCIEGDIQV